MDRDQMLYQLGIKLPLLPAKADDPDRPAGIWPVNDKNPEGNWTNGMRSTITRSPFGLWNNYSDRYDGFFPGPDSGRLGDYAPIDLLKMHDGTSIKSADDWWKLRRPEIKNDLEEYLYGRIPADSLLPDVTWKVETTTGGTGSGAYIQKVITGTLGISRFPEVRDRPVISATLRTPQNATAGVPVMIFFGGFGNIKDLYWQRSFPEGWGTCIFDPNLLQPDNGAGLTSYLIGLVNKGAWRKPGDWGTLVAWSWGVSRLIDYLETDKHVNAHIIGLTGHSRYGKATLVTMAYEPRIAVGFPSDAGSLGTKMNRRHWGQDLENSTGPNEYHWMAGNFFKWAGEKLPGQYLPRKIGDCPVDAHSMLALCAPRPVFINGGTNSSWCDPYGMYLTAKYASPVYMLSGVQGLIMNDAKPLTDTAYIEGNIAYRYHTGGHTDVPDWPAFFKFAAKHFSIPFLNVSASSLIFGASADLEAKLKVSASGKTEIVPSDYWIKVDNDDDPDSIIISIQENRGGDLSARSGFITISSEGRKQVVFVHQATVKPSLEVSQHEVQIDEKEGSKGSFTIISNSAWAISSDADWLTLSDEAGTAVKKIIVTASANKRVQKRVATVKIKSPDMDSDFLLSVIQKEATPFLNVSTGSIIISAMAGEINLAITSNTSWELNTSSDWIKTGTRAGDASRQVVLSFDENPSAAVRKGSVTIIANGVDPKVIQVIQNGTMK
jgi:hypothetical protein